MTIFKTRISLEMSKKSPSANADQLLVRESLIKSEYSISRHSGGYQNPVKPIVYWMLVFTSMTMEVLDLKFLSLNQD